MLLGCFNPFLYLWFLLNLPGQIFLDFLLKSFRLSSCNFLVVLKLPNCPFEYANHFAHIVVHCTVIFYHFLLEVLLLLNKILSWFNLKLGLIQNHFDVFLRCNFLLLTLNYFYHFVLNFNKKFLFFHKRIREEFQIRNTFYRFWHATQLAGCCIFQLLGLVLEVLKD